MYSKFGARLSEVYISTFKYFPIKDNWKVQAMKNKILMTDFPTLVDSPQTL